MWEKRARPKALPSFAELVPEGAAAAAAGSDPTLTSLTACKALKGLGDAQKAGGGGACPFIPPHVSRLHSSVVSPLPPVDQ
jgi:hypothetical protein